MKLHLHPTRTAGAAENMALDFLLLQRYPDATVPRFRHYGWQAPAFTFGYAQKHREVCARLVDAAGTDERFELCRRPTGGGIVDHRSDWTYALVIPRGHPLEELRASGSYRVVHEALAAALGSLGVACHAKLESPAPEPTSPAPGRTIEPVCFERAETHDVVVTATGTKIAGAAQKRNKHGLLFQGSIWKPAAGMIDWEEFATSFTTRLGAALDATPEPRSWPEFDEDEVSGLTERYSSSEWNEFR